MCYRCGRFGHPEVRCQHDHICLQCGKAKHERECTRWCVNCKKAGHSCLARDCEVWPKEKEICRIKVEREVSYSQARQHYDQTHDPPVLKVYATVVRMPSTVGKMDEQLKDKVGRLETKVGEIISLLEQLLKNKLILMLSVMVVNMWRPDRLLRRLNLTQPRRQRDLRT